MMVIVIICMYLSDYCCCCCTVVWVPQELNMSISQCGIAEWWFKIPLECSSPLGPCKDR